MIRKLLSCFLAAMMMLVPLTTGASAADASSAQKTEGIIPTEVAEIMATYFVRDAQEMPNNHWTSDTYISDTVTMYDGNGEISAYSFELKTAGQDAGYVVISAYSDIANKVLEYSDSAKPMYTEFNLTSKDKVVYT